MWCVMIKAQESHLSGHMLAEGLVTTHELSVAFNPAPDKRQDSRMDGDETVLGFRGLDSTPKVGFLQIGGYCLVGGYAESGITHDQNHFDVGVI